MSMKINILFSFLFSSVLIGQDMFLECENLFLSKSNTKWIGNECVKINPKTYDYIAIDETNNSFEIYEWDIGLQGGATLKKNNQGNLQECGGVYIYGEDLIDELIKTDSTWYLYTDIYTSYIGSAEISPSTIFLTYISRNTGEVYDRKNINRLSGKIFDGTNTSHQCKSIDKKVFDNVLNEMKSDNAKLKKELKKHFKNKRIF